nr:immunoglobulin kappa light chain isoform X1 [Nothobranchius furzeri]
MFPVLLLVAGQSNAVTSLKCSENTKLLSTRHDNPNTMISTHFISCLACFLLGTMVQETHLTASSVHQDSSLVSADVGDSVTLRCSFEGTESAWVYWYKQTLGQKPKLMSSFFIYGSEITFYDEFRNDRFTLIREKQTNSLTISDLKASDSASYYCGIMHTQVLTFAEGATVSVKDTGIQTLVHQSASETIRLEGSVTLNCSVQTGTCDGEHSVYWFKDSKDSRPGLIYSRRGRNDQCEREPNTQTHTCVYNLPLNNLNASHTGTYYCAVASCGHILFGNGTTLNFSRELDFLVYFLAGTLTTLLVVLLVFLLYRMKKRNQAAEPSVPADATTRRQVRLTLTQSSSFTISVSCAVTFQPGYIAYNGATAPYTSQAVLQMS